MGMMNSYSENELIVVIKKNFVLFLDECIGTLIYQALAHKKLDLHLKIINKQ